MPNALERWSIAVAVGLAGLTGPAAASAAQWSVVPDAHGAPRLIYHLARPVPVGDARIEVRLDGRVVGYPVVRGSELLLEVVTVPPGDLGALEIWLSGRRIDGAPTALPHDRTPLAATAPAPSGRLVGSDPAKPGRYRTSDASYALPAIPIAPFGQPVEVLGDVIYPLGAPGPRPLVLFLHGRHGTCFRGGPRGEESGGWPCPSGFQPIPSQLGYRYVARRLATQGYVTVSIAANGINGQDDVAEDGGASARSILVRHHLDLWRRWAAGEAGPLGTTFSGKVDMTRVVLVGHSRGGEGVERAAIDSNPGDGYTIRGLVLYGPTAFGHQAAAGVPTTVLLPYCDGDVSDLEGQSYVDGSLTLTRDRTLRSSVLVMGANHNFFNSQWTPGDAVAPSIDDWFDPRNSHCGARRPTRLTAAEQRAVGITYTAAAVLASLTSNRDAYRLLDGSGVRARSQGRADVRTAALGARRVALLRPSERLGRVSARGLTARVCAGYGRHRCAPRVEDNAKPHWLMPLNTPPSPRALELTWSSAGGSATVRLRRPVDLRTATDLDLRVAVDPKSPPAALGVSIVDEAGRILELGAPAARLAALPGGPGLSKLWGQILRARIPRSTTGVALGRVRAIVLTPRSGSGHVYVLDADGRAPGRDRRPQTAVPRIDAETIAVPEGGPGTRTVNVHLHVTGAVRRGARIWLQRSDTSTGTTENRAIVIAPGTRDVDVPFDVAGDSAYNPSPASGFVLITAERDVTVGAYSGGLKVAEDDPAPTLTATPTVASAPEGGALGWTFNLSAPIAGTIIYSLSAVADTAGPAELSTADLFDASLEAFGITLDPVRALSVRGGLTGQPATRLLEFGPETTSQVVTLEIRADGIAEGEETTALRIDVGAGEDPILPTPLIVRGSVTEQH